MIPDTVDDLRAVLGLHELAHTHVPARALHVEGREHAADGVAVPDLERRLAVDVRVREEHVARRPPRARTAELRAVGEHQPAEQLAVVLTRRVRDVERPAADRARRRVHPRVLVRAREHVPVGRAWQKCDATP